MVETASHLCLAVVDRGPSWDNLELHAVARRTRRRHAFKALAGTSPTTASTTSATSSSGSA